MSDAAAPATPAPRAPEIGDDVLFYFEFRGGLRKRPGKVTEVGPEGKFANLVIWYDGANDGRQYLDRIGWELNARRLADGEKPSAHTWSLK